MGTTRAVCREADALRYVFGYSVMIDVSARDNRRAGQWIYSKGQDTYAPFGPCIVTADEIADPHALDLWLTVNGVEKQRSNTRHMLFKVPLLIADISAAITLEPGDIIATGTPDGVGAGRTPQEWLWPGDVVEARSPASAGSVIPWWPHEVVDAVRHGDAGSRQPLQDPDGDRDAAPDRLGDDGLRGWRRQRRAL